MNSWCLNLPHRDSSGSMQSPCLIQKRRQISSTLQPTWACLHQWRVSLHSGSHLNWLPLGVFLLAGYSAPLSFWKSLFCLHVFNLWGSDWTYRLWYSLLHRWIAASTQIGCNLAVFNRRWFPSYCGFITIFTNQSHIDQPFWSQWDRRFFAHGCNNIGHPRSPPTVFSSATVLQWLNWSINGIHLFNGAVEHFFTQTCYFLRCWWESL